MKRMSEIAKELRENGYKFGQVGFKQDLETIPPLFKEGKVVFYPDNTAELLQSNYKRKVVVTEKPAPEKETDANVTQLDRIEATVVALSKLFSEWNPKPVTLKNRSIEVVRKAE